jgi:ribosomal protein S18 acetylase RimI-like enzyme
MPLLNIHDIAVLPAWRGRGIARRLLDAITQHASALGCCRLTLEVRGDNTPARALYRRAGFMPAGCELFLEKPLA